MNYLPSKEVLTEILKENVKEVYEIGSNPNFKDNTLLFNLNGCGELCNINIYELAHKCKEWAYNDKSLCGYSIELKSYKSEFGYWLCELMSEDITFSGDTEPEAIFAACQWIIDNRS